MTAITDTRAREIAAALDEADSLIETYQATKRDLLTALRDELGQAGFSKAEVRAHVEGLKLAARRARQARVKPEAAEQAEERDALADHYQTVLTRDARHAHPRTREDDETRQDAGGRGGCGQDGRPSTLAQAGSDARVDSIASDPAPQAAAPEVTPRPQDEGLPVRVGSASDDVPVGDRGKHAPGQSEAFVTSSGAGEASATACDPVPAADDEVSRQRAALAAEMQARFRARPLKPSDPQFEHAFIARHGRPPVGDEWTTGAPAAAPQVAA